MKSFVYVFIILITLTACSSDDSLEKNNIQEPTKTTVVETTIDDNSSSPLTGKKVLDNNGQHFAVMIENSLESRPQSGLGDADIVYEIKTEGNISRYLAFYHDKIPEIIGPVRSSRHYFIPLAEGLNFPYVHFGASTYAYEYLTTNELKIPHIDGIKEGQYFFRDTSRVAPHNAYLKTDTLDSFSDFKITNKSFSFGITDNTHKENATSIELSYNNFTDILYVYDEIQKSYLRFQENEPHIDKNSGEQIKVNNVIIQYAKHENIHEDKKGRIDVSLSGVGNITLFSEGKITRGTWKKGISDNSVTYYDEGGKILQLSKGVTWFQVVEKDSVVSFN